MYSVNQILEPYGFQSQEHQKLDGYASTNYRVEKDGTNYLLKHYANADEEKIIREEARILDLLQDQKLPFQVPASIEKLVHYNDQSFSRLLPFIEGQQLSSAKQTDELIYNFGQAAGQLNKGLLGVKNEVIESRELFWDMKHTLFNEPKLAYINDPTDRKVVSYFFDLFSHNIIPIQNDLRKGIIHSDLNDDNVIVENGRVKGLIDFGDITYSPLIYEVAIACAYIMLANETEPFEKAREFIKGYHDILPLKKNEIELLQILIPSRLCVSVCNSAKKKSEGKETEYILVSEKPAWKLLHKWLSLNPKWITDYFLQSIDLETDQLDETKLLEKRKELTGKSLKTSYKEPIYMIGGAFQYMYDNLGNTYLDAYNNIPHIGHCHPNISKAISSQVRKLNTNTRYLYPEIVEFASELGKTLPKQLNKIFYLNSGSAASDVAIRMAFIHSDKNRIAILANGYHGNTISGISISDYKHSGEGGGGKPSHVLTLDLPKVFNGKYSTGKEYAQEAINKISNEISAGRHPAALIVEPVSGCGGQVPLAKGYLESLVPYLKENEILLISDEVQTGFGRLGSFFWGFEMHNVIPDILILGKPMGNGHPIAAVVTTSEIAESFANGMEFFSSFGGNPVSCRVALEVLKTVREENLQANSEKVGALLKQGLFDLKREFPCIRDVRGAGLFLGVEFYDRNDKPSSELAGSVKESLKERFILVGTDGPLNNVIKIKPPLCFNEENVKHFLTQFKDSVESAVAV